MEAELERVLASFLPEDERIAAESALETRSRSSDPVP